MANTDRIVFKNLDSVITRVKEWVLEKYPMTYNKDEHDLNVYNSLDATDVSITVKNNGISSGVSVMSDKALLKTDGASIYSDNEFTPTVDGKAGNTTFSLQETDGTMTSSKAVFTSGAQSMSNDNGVVTLKGDKVELNGGAHDGADIATIILDEEEVFLKDNASTPDKHGRVFIGIEPDSVPDGNKKPHGIYLGSIYPMGYSLSGSGTETVASGTTPTEFQHVGAMVNLSAGTWIVTFSMSYPDSVDGRRLCGSVFVGGAEDVESKCVQSASAGGVHHMSVAGSTIVEVPIGGTKLVQLAGYQNTGVAKSVAFEWTATRVG